MTHSAQQSEGGEGDGKLVSLAELQAAQEHIRPFVVRPPLTPYPLRELWLKPESLQATGAFKARGAFNLLLSLTAEQRQRGVVAHSSGNHAQAVAYAARQLGIPAVVVMPATAPEIKKQMTAAYGAEVVLVGPASAERAAKAEQLAYERGLTHVPPYDDLRIIAGAGTVGLEILEDRPEVRAVVVPVSGGGLLAGVAAAIKLQRPDVRVLGAEPALAADTHDSLRAGQRIEYPAEQVGRTLADGLRVQIPGRLTFPHLQRFVDGVITVSEDEIRQAVRDTAHHARLVAEPSGAVSVAAALYHHDQLGTAGEVVAVLSGGNLDASLLAELLAEHAPA